MDMLLYPEELTKLHNHVATVYELFIRAAAKAGAHAIFFCEDMGSQKGLLFSPALWNQYFAELYAKLFSLAHDLNLKVIMHSCGKNSEILEPLLKAGVDCFQFDQPTLYDMGQLSALLRRYKAAIWSPIDIQKILPTGNTEIIANGVKDMLSNFGGFIIFKQYPDLKGIGVDEAWDNYAYNQIINNIRL
jgi:uroporphyrinogen decarboxylase